MSEADRHCRLLPADAPSNATFTNVHHVVIRGNRVGQTDLENLVLMCQHHHYRLHSSGWSLTGNANEELTFIPPTGRAMTSFPLAALGYQMNGTSRLWSAA